VARAAWLGLDRGAVFFVAATSLECSSETPRWTWLGTLSRRQAWVEVHRPLGTQRSLEGWGLMGRPWEEEGAREEDPPKIAAPRSR
jgi:hypothetical protein